MKITIHTLLINKLGKKSVLSTCTMLMVELQRIALSRRQNSISSTRVLQAVDAVNGKLLHLRDLVLTIKLSQVLMVVFNNYKINTKTNNNSNNNLVMLQTISTIIGIIKTQIK